MPKLGSYSKNYRVPLSEQIPPNERPLLRLSLGLDKESYDFVYREAQERGIALNKAVIEVLEETLLQKSNKVNTDLLVLLDLLESHISSADNHLLSDLPNEGAA